MGHLINPISLQLKYHGSWKLTWSQFLRKDFAYFFFIDQYIKSIVKSILLLKSFFNKFFFYEFKFFIKNNKIIFYFSFKFIKKTAFRFYWKYTYKKHLTRKFTKLKQKPRGQFFFEKRFIKTNLSFNKVNNKVKVFGNFKKYLFLLTSMVFKAKKKSFPYDLYYRLNAISFRINNFTHKFNKYKFDKDFSFNNYLLNYGYLLYLKVGLRLSFRLKLLILKEIAFNGASKLYGNKLYFALNTIQDFTTIKTLLSNLIFINSCIKVFMNQYFYKEQVLIPQKNRNIISLTNLKN